jgi:hypothetical protein
LVLCVFEWGGAPIPRPPTPPCFMPLAGKNWGLSALFKTLLFMEPNSTPGRLYLSFRIDLLHVNIFFV